MEQPRSRFAVAERLICKLRDVVSCEIRAGHDGTIEAIHVTARSGRAPKQIARDVESILAAEENLRVDHRKISIAQYGAQAPQTQETLDRVVLAAVSLHQVGGSLEAEVTLSSGNHSAGGTATGSGTRADSRRVVALATLSAIAKISAEDPHLALAELEERELGEHRVLMVCITQMEGRHERHLFGCCEVGHDTSRSVIYAVLDAVNRVLGTLPPREPVEYEIGPAPVA